MLLYIVCPCTGVRVSLAEVDAVLQLHPSVHAASSRAWPVPGQQSGELCDELQSGFVSEQIRYRATHCRCSSTAAQFISRNGHTSLKHLGPAYFTAVCKKGSSVSERTSLSALLVLYIHHTCTSHATLLCMQDSFHLNHTCLLALACRYGVGWLCAAISQC